MVTNAVFSLIKKMQALDADEVEEEIGRQSDESEDTEQGEMDDDINRNISSVDDKNVIEIVVD